jgi:X-X-X-Leu-X-X-Gly heptad repeat protein
VTVYRGGLARQMYGYVDERKTVPALAGDDAVVMFAGAGAGAVPLIAGVVTLAAGAITLAAGAITLASAGATTLASAGAISASCWRRLLVLNSCTQKVTISFRTLSRGTKSALSINGLHYVNEWHKHTATDKPDHRLNA